MADKTTESTLLEGMTPEQMIAVRELVEEQSILYIDGKTINPFLDLTARQIDEYRAVLRDTFGDDPDEAPDHHLVAAVVYVVRKQDSPDYTIEQAQDVPLREVRKPPEGKKNGRPTRAKAKP